MTRFSITFVFMRTSPTYSSIRYIWARFYVDNMSFTRCPGRALCSLWLSCSTRFPLGIEYHLISRSNGSKGQGCQG